jgi:DNA-binding beta-propeller fold protein YncE
MGFVRTATALAALCLASACQASPRTVAATDAGSPLRLERKISLPDVAGRIDHLAIDPAHRLLFVAEIANGTIDAVDLAAGKVVGRIAGLHEPQGIAVLADGQVVVACGDGSVHFYAPDRHEIATLALGDDADNVRIDARNGHVLVGYGDGGLAVIDPATHQVLARVELPGHPEGFRMVGPKALINIPDRGAIVEADLDAGKVVASWKTSAHRLNFALALAPAGQRFAVAYRLPAALEVRDFANGTVISTRSACGDADDLFVDGERFLLVCGAGHVDISPITEGKSETVRVTTAPGARTGLFVPELKTLFVAAPARGGRPAAIWVLRTG